MSSLHELLPNAIWQHFSAICDIPHPSFHEQQILDHLIGFARQNQLDYSSDEAGNLIIRKPATSGMEDRVGVIIQGHVDMVPQKNEDTLHDFTTDPIQAYINGEWVTARGTTLGADNGIGVAAALAVLESDTLEHGAIEALFTVNEEAGMTGAQELKQGMFEGKILLNLDTEDEGELYAGCAGGVFIKIDDTYIPEASGPSEKSVFQTLILKGLNGGHSGCDIHLGRGNAIKLMTRLLRRLEALDIRVASFNGGSLANAIPRESSAVIAIPSESRSDAIRVFEECREELMKELAIAEPGLTLTMTEAKHQTSVMPAAIQRNWLVALDACPNGALRMSDNIEGVVETSSNMGVLTLSEGKIHLQVLPRSLSGSANDAIRDTIAGLFSMVEASIKFEDSYPGWTPDPQSRILAIMKTVYQDIFGKIPAVKVIHAGLECGLLGSKYPDWDMVSFGPTIRFPHSPGEKVHIESVRKFWDLLVATLKAIPAKQ